MKMKPTKTALALAGVFTLTILNAPQAAAVTEVNGWTQADHVTGTVDAPGVNGNATTSYFYHFQVHNDSTSFGDPYGLPIPVIVDWELPYYSDMGISGIFSASGWAHEIATIGTPNAGTGWSGDADWIADPTWSSTPFAAVTQVIHWYCDGGEGGVASASCGILPANQIGDFGFYAGFGPTNAPYQSSWDYVIPRRVGDPDFPFAPASPSACGNSVVGACNNVPEPGTLGLLGVGMAAAFGVGRKKRRNPA